MDRLMVTKIQRIAVAAILILLTAGGGLSPAKASESHPEKAIDKIVAGVEARYNVSGFTADFEQEAILTAMAVTDTASGRLMVRQPGKMRWEYLVPDPQVIITDGDDLWVYRPEENQVMVGKAPAFFGKGKGAGFLSNIKSVRKNFQISMEAVDDPSLYRLHLVPLHGSQDFMAMKLDITQRDFLLVRIVTYNVYGDETRIELKNFNFNETPPESLFRFVMPDGADVVQMNP